MGALERSEQDRLDVIWEAERKRGDVVAEDTGRASVGEKDFGAWPVDSESHFLRDLERKQKEQRELLNNAQSKELAEMEKRQQEALRALVEPPKDEWCCACEGCMKKGQCCGPQTPATCMTGTSAKTKEEHERWEKEVAAVKDQHPKEIKEKQVAFEKQKQEQEKMQAEEKRAFQE